MDDNKNQIEPSVVMDAAKKPIVDRVTLEKKEGEKVQRWLSQLQEGSKGFLQLTKSDVVNFLIRQHADDFTKREQLQIRKSHYDPIKHLMWITPKLKQAMAEGNFELVSALQQEIRSIELSVVSDAEAKANGIREGAPLNNRGKKSKKQSLKDEAQSVRIDANSTLETKS